MTGYASTDGEAGFSLEIRGYNSRFLETQVALPPEFAGWEADIRGMVASCCRRGKVDVTLMLRRESGRAALRLNRQALRSVLRAAAKAREIALACGESLDGGSLSLNRLLSLPGVLEPEETSWDKETLWTAVKPALEEALRLFDAARRREGAAISGAILAQLAAIEAAREAVAAMAAGLEAALEANLKKRFASLQVEYEFDQNRVLAEVAVLLMKYTITEELDRLSAHLACFRAEAAENEAPGKKLDFLCQEMGREVNTIGSKAPQLEVSRAVVTMKDALENIREQLRNVE